MGTISGRGFEEKKKKEKYKNMRSWNVDGKKYSFLCCRTDNNILRHLLHFSSLHDEKEKHFF